MQTHVDTVLEPLVPPVAYTTTSLDFPAYRVAVG